VLLCLSRKFDAQISSLTTHFVILHNWDSRTL
jgi:hypothetical protein